MGTFFIKNFLKNKKSPKFLTFLALMVIISMYTKFICLVEDGYKK